MVVVSHSVSHGLLIFVLYLEKGKVLLIPKVLKCVYIHVGLYYTYWDLLQAKFEKKIDL